MHNLYHVFLPGNDSDSGAWWPLLGGGHMGGAGWLPEGSSSAFYIKSSAFSRAGTVSIIGADNSFT